MSSYDSARIRYERAAAAHYCLMQYLQAERLRPSARGRRITIDFGHGDPSLYEAAAVVAAHIAARLDELVAAALKAAEAELRATEEVLIAAIKAASASMPAPAVRASGQSGE